MTKMRAAEEVVEDLFAAFMDRPQALPEEWRANDVSDKEGLAQRICDYRRLDRSLRGGRASAGVRRHAGSQVRASSRF